MTSLIAMVDRHSGRLGHCDLPDRALPAIAASPIGIAIELLAGIPSIIYGMWGFFVLGPFLAYTFQPFMIGLFDGVPVLGTIFGGPPVLI